MRLQLVSLTYQHSSYLFGFLLKIQWAIVRKEFNCLINVRNSNDLRNRLINVFTSQRERRKGAVVPFVVYLVAWELACTNPNPPTPADKFHAEHYPPPPPHGFCEDFLCTFLDTLQLSFHHHCIHLSFHLSIYLYSLLSSMHIFETLHFIFNSKLLI